MCVRACVRACVRVCVRARARVRVCVCFFLFFFLFFNMFLDLEDKIKITRKRDKNNLASNPIKEIVWPAEKEEHPFYLILFHFVGFWGSPQTPLFYIFAINICRLFRFLLLKTTFNVIKLAFLFVLHHHHHIDVHVSNTFTYI